MTTPAEKRAKKKYRAKVNHFSLEFYPKEKDLWEQLQKQPNKAGYLKGLIAKDLEKCQNSS